MTVTSWAKPISNSYALIEIDGVFEASVEDSISIARDKLVSVLHQIITGSRAKYFVPVLELIATSFQSIIGSDGGGNDAQKCTHRFGMRNLHATRNVLRESLACLPNAPDAEKGSRRSNWSEISGFILA